MAAVSCVISLGHATVDGICSGTVTQPALGGWRLFGFEGCADTSRPVRSVRVSVSVGLSHWRSCLIVFSVNFMNSIWKRRIHYVSPGRVQERITPPV